MTGEQSQATVAIVVPCYQSASYLAETVESVRSQTMSDWQLVIVDDGSTDQPGAVIRGPLQDDARIQLVRQDNRGVAAARNTGARAVGPSRYILFLDADDVLEATMLETLVTWLDAHPDAGAVFCRPAFIDEHSRPTEMAWAPRLRRGRFGIDVIPESEPLTPFLSLFSLAGVVPSLTLVRRSIFDSTDGWDEEFGQHYEDTLLFLQVALLAEVHYVNEPLVRHRRHPGQSTGDFEKFDRQERKLYARLRDLSSFTPAEQDVLLDAWRFRERRLIPQRGVKAAVRSLRAGSPVTATRFMAGAVRIALGSLLLGPARIRS